MRFAFDDQVAAQPDALRAVLARDLGGVALDGARRVIFSGLGTSLHACRVAQAWIAALSGGQLRAHVLDTHELAGAGAACVHGDQVVMVTHGGGHPVTRLAIGRARASGATVIVVCGDHAPDHGVPAIRTGPRERAGTHSVSYLCALAMLGRLIETMVGGGRLLRAIEAAPAAIDAALAIAAPVAAAAQLAGREPILVAGAGIAAVSASEAALKLKEATYRWAEGMFVEQALHGPHAAMRPGMGAIVFAPPAPGMDVGRVADLRRVLAAIGVDTQLVGGGAGDTLRHAPIDPLAHPLVAIVPVQRLVAEMARLLGTNPDVTHEDQEPWRSAIAPTRARRQGR